MTYYLKLYGVTLGAFLALDMLWLGWLARPFYQKQLGFLLAPETNWLAALVFYLLFVAGLLVFVVVPGLQADSLQATLLRAALFGLVTYAAYDLTNHATVKDWPFQVTVVDMLWGTVLSTVVSGISFTVGRLWR
jgi:uncharacterized membrane protein